MSTSYSIHQDSMLTIELDESSETFDIDIEARDLDCIDIEKNDLDRKMWITTRRRWTFDEVIDMGVRILYVVLCWCPERKEEIIERIRNL